MLNRAFMTSVLVALSTVAITKAVQADEAATKLAYADTNGLHMYYEITGDGAPVIVLHGAFMSTSSMKPITDGLSKSRQVIAVDLQAHGRTGDIDRPLSYQGMADDVAALMDAIGVSQADVFGYSMGGGTAYQLAIRHPEKVRRLAVASAGFRIDGSYPEMMEMMKSMTPQMFAGSPWEAEYKNVAPNPHGFPGLVEKIVAMAASIQDWPEGDMRAIKAPTLVISGDADVIRPEHAVDIYRLRGGGHSPDFMTAPVAELAILPGTTHLGIIEKADLVTQFVTAFFDKPIK